MHKTHNILNLDDIDFSQNKEAFQDILKHKHFSIERIVSYGQSSEDWYDQDSNEWLILLQGRATILYDNNTSIQLKKGDTLFIPAHHKHKVSYTSKRPPCVWLTVFFK
ncbi:MAG: cupin domain-containing protein [Bacteroidales bacterium]|jgi:cupin 2 domain-containing protein